MPRASVDRRTPFRDGPEDCSETTTENASSSTSVGWIRRICDRLGLERNKRSQQKGIRPYSVDRRAQWNKDVELREESLKVGDRVLSKEDLGELTEIGQAPHDKDGPA